jgi:hypothetical protein
MRQQEFAELFQAALELTRASKRALLRTEQLELANKTTKTENPTPSSKLREAIEAMQFTVDVLHEVAKDYPEDNISTMKQLLQERKNAPGWETWGQLLKQRVKISEITTNLLQREEDQPLQTKKTINS